MASAVNIRDRGSGRKDGTHFWELEKYFEQNQNQNPPSCQHEANDEIPVISTMGTTRSTILRRHMSIVDDWHVDSATKAMMTREECVIVDCLQKVTNSVILRGQVVVEDGMHDILMCMVVL